MAVNYGKQFEAKFKEDWLKIENSTIDRLYDSMNGFYAISNISDFIGFKEPNIFYLEVKSHAGNTFPLGNLTQYEKLKAKVGIPGVRAGVVIWFYERDTVVYVPISSITQMKKDNKKSVNVKMLEEGVYKIINIPSKKKRVFMDSDYSVLLNLEDGD